MENVTQFKKQNRELKEIETKVDGSVTISFPRQRALEFENLNLGSSGLKRGSSSREPARASCSSIPGPPIKTDLRVKST